MGLWLELSFVRKPDLLLDPAGRCCAGCDFWNLGGTLPAIMAKSDVRIVNSTVSETFVPDVDEGVIVSDIGATVWLQGTSASSNKAVMQLIAKSSRYEEDGAFYSDREDEWFLWDGGDYPEQEQRDAGRVPSDTSAFLSFDDEWFASVRQVRVPSMYPWGVLVLMLGTLWRYSAPTSVSCGFFIVPTLSALTSALGSSGVLQAHMHAREA